MNIFLFSLGLFGLIFGFIGMLLYDGDRVKEYGMFQGYNTVTWTVVALQVCQSQRSNVKSSLCLFS